MIPVKGRPKAGFKKLRYDEPDFRYQRNLMKFFTNLGVEVE